MNHSIQILRGISVLLVVLFHLSIDMFSFGYIGVDIFFMISGFLMPIILPKYDAVSFIWARTKRLLPALLYLNIFVITACYFLSMPGEYFDTAIASLFSLGFLSEFYFFFNTGYFDQISNFRPLLHTWSLGNEYLGYLLIFIFLLLFKKKYSWQFPLLLTFLFAIYILAAPYDISYLDPLPRLYLFFFGYTFSILVEIHSGLFKKNILIIKLISILSLSALLLYYGGEIINEQWPNNGILLFPFVLLPFLLNQANLINNSILGKLLSRLGDWSYSIYIWHWPLIAFERIYFRNEHLSNLEILFLLFLSLIFGFLSYNYLERFRSRKQFLIVVATYFVFISFVIITNGFSDRVSKELIPYSNKTKLIAPELFKEKFDYDNLTVSTVRRSQNTQTILLLGDSHSHHIAPLFYDATEYSIYRIRLQPDEVLQNWLSLLQFIDDFRINHIYIAYRFYIKDYDSLQRFSNLLKENQKFGITVIRDVPSLPFDPVACLISNNSTLISKKCGVDIKKGFPLGLVLNRLDKNWNVVLEDLKDTEVNLIDTHPILCSSESQLCSSFVNQELIMRDDNHLNEKLSKQTNILLFKAFFKEDIDDY